MSGYTSKLAGTVRGITEPQATFSTCFGAPFMPYHPSVYAKLLGDKIDAYNSNVYLINTGWSGGPYGVGKRMKLSYTRAMVTAALEGKLDNVEYKLDPIFNVLVPQSCPEVPDEILNPKNTWKNAEEYEKLAHQLAERFAENFKKFKNVSEDIAGAGPRP
jgi:phosphoenolpyruvate carboxykinase (ATP)